MKTLYIIRHAKSSWKDIALDDFQRPLNKRGKEDAFLMSKRLSELNLFPDLILSSPSKRTQCTVDIIASHLGYTKDIVFDHKIYESNMINLKNIVKNLDNNKKSVFLIGHNPGLNMLAEELCGFLKNIVTTGIVIIDFDCNSWSKISKENSKLREYIYPKKYK